MAQSNIIHQVEKIELISWGFLTTPHIEIVISHKEWDDTITKIAMSFHFDSFAVLYEILRNLGNETLTAIVNNKMGENKALAEKALATE